MPLLAGAYCNALQLARWSVHQKLHVKDSQPMPILVQIVIS